MPSQYLLRQDGFRHSEWSRMKPYEAVKLSRSFPETQHGSEMGVEQHTDLTVPDGCGSSDGFSIFSIFLRFSLGKGFATPLDQLKSGPHIHKHWPVVDSGRQIGPWRRHIRRSLFELRFCQTGRMLFWELPGWSIRCFLYFVWFVDMFCNGTGSESLRAEIWWLMPPCV